LQDNENSEGVPAAAGQEPPRRAGRDRWIVRGASLVGVAAIATGVGFGVASFAGVGSSHSVSSAIPAPAIRTFGGFGCALTQAPTSFP